MPLLKFSSYLLILLICISCQRDSNQQSTFSSTAKDTSPPEDWVDPLFFIDGQLCQHLRKIFQDSRGDLWFGTNVYGIMRYDGDTLEYFDEGHGLAGGRVTGIVEDSAGNVWFGTANGLSKYTASENNPGVQFENYATDQGLEDKEIWSLFLDDNDQFWVGTTQGLYQFDGQSFSAFDLPKAAVPDTVSIYSEDRITDIIKDRTGTYWFVTDGFGITCYHPEKGFQFFTKENGLPNNSISSLMEDSRGNIWIATMLGGLGRYSDGKFITYPYSTIKGWEIGALYEDLRSQVWFASENHGVYQYDPTSDSFTQFNKAQGLLTDGILSFYEDTSGRFWLGGWGGLFRYYPDQKNPAFLFRPVTALGPWN
ncbi:MAG: two-component regulator propeller domain-containing protein [Cytophagales bacterium]|nr:two-component regulator propeller domain-containing protein [Cytophagales bacterium]